MDLDFLGKGRHWANFKNQPRVLLEDNVKELRFLLADGSASSHLGILENTADQTWLDALRIAINRNVNSTNSSERWKAFAGYVR